MINLYDVINKVEDFFNVVLKKSNVPESYAGYRSVEGIEYSWFVHNYIYADTDEIYVIYYVDLIKDKVTLSCSQTIADKTHLDDFFIKVEDVDNLVNDYLNR